MDDLIKRQDAIDAIMADKIEDGLPVITDTQERDFEVFNSSCDRHAKILKELPSAKKMDDLISRQDAIDACLNGCCACVHDCVDEIKKLPSAEPVIRCKDCKHNYLDGIQVRFNRCELNHSKVHGDDWFCADGERKEQ